MLLEMELIGSRKIYFVMTCGGENGNAGEHNRKLAETCYRPGGYDQGRGEGAQRPRNAGLCEGRPGPDPLPAQDRAGRQPLRL